MNKSPAFRSSETAFDFRSQTSDFDFDFDFRSLEYMHLMNEAQTSEVWNEGKLACKTYEVSLQASEVWNEGIHPLYNKVN